MALMHGAKRLLGRMAAAATADPQAGLSEGVELLTPARPLHTIRLNAAFAPLVRPAPQSCLETPSMMSAAERHFLVGLATRYYEGQGIIVDAGIFLGASTRCFGEGVRSNPNREAITRHWPHPIVSYERAIVNPNMPRFFEKHGLAFAGAVGESFESELRRHVEPVKDLVDLRIGDFMNASAPECPVEILFLDILKDARLSLHAFRLFYPYLIPGRTLVIHQDYFFDELPWIKTHQERLADHFEYVGEIGSSAVFLCRKQIPQATVDELAHDLPPAEQLRLASIALHRSVDPARRFLMALSKMRLIRKLEGRGPARTYLEWIRAEFPEQVAQTEKGRLSQALRKAEEFLVRKPRKDRKGG